MRWMREQGELSARMSTGSWWARVGREVGRDFVRNGEPSKAFWGQSSKNFKDVSVCVCRRDLWNGDGDGDGQALHRDTGMGKVVRLLMSGAVITAANEVGFLQICVGNSPGLVVQEGVSSTWSFSCGWNLPLREFFGFIKCELTLSPSQDIYQVSPAYFHELLQHL